MIRIKTVFSTCFLLLSIILLSGQPPAIKIEGMVLDAETRKPLTGAHVILKSFRDDIAGTALVNGKGYFRIDNVFPGGYQLHVSYIGYKSLVMDVRFFNEDLNLGNIFLENEPKELEEVSIVASTPMALVKEDTLEMHADAYKVTPDATAEDLVGKMPGVEVDGGTVKAQGEEVKKVTVDGRQLFDQDPVVALRNLPAEIVEKIQVFDEQSEQARFTGFDDGQTTKTINVITRRGMRNGIMGKVSAGAGDNEAYSLSGNLNYFKENQRISLVGQSNNINNQGFTMQDFLGVTGAGGGMTGGGMGRSGGGRGGSTGGGMPGGGGFIPREGGDFFTGRQNGISTTNALGINYSNTWNGKLQLTGSYFFNKVDNVVENYLDQEYFMQTGSQTYSQDLLSNNINYNHRLFARVQYDIDSSNRIFIMPRLSLQDNSSWSATSGETVRDLALLNNTDNNRTSDNKGYSFSNTFLYMHSFPKKGRSLSLNINTSLNNKDANTNLFAENTYYQREILLSDTIDQYTSNINNTNSVTSRISYMEPVSSKGIIQFNYQNSYRWNDADKVTSDFNDLTATYNLTDTLLSNIFKNTYITHQVGTGYRFVGERMNFNAGLDYELADLENNREFPVISDYKYHFTSLLPNAMINYKVNTSKNLRLMYRSNTNLPSIDQLQDVLDNSDPLRLKSGNAELKQEYQNMVFLRYQSANISKASVFYALIRLTTRNNYIANSTYMADRDTTIRGIDLFKGQQLIIPVNLDGYISGSLFLTYGIPVKLIKCSINLNSSLSISRRPGYINGVDGVSTDRSAGLGISLNSNISQNIDFTISSNSNYSIPVSTFQDNLSNNYFYQRTNLRFKYIFWKGLVINTQFNHTYYHGLSEGYNQNYALWNISLGKKLFNNQRGEIAFSINDALNQNKNIERNITDLYIEDSRSNVLQRFYLLTFTYDLRKMGV